MKESDILNIYRKASLAEDTYSQIRSIVTIVNDIEIMVRWSGLISHFYTDNIVSVKENEYLIFSENSDYNYSNDTISISIKYSGNNEFLADISDLILSKNICDDAKVLELKNSITKVQGIIYHDVRNVLGGVNGIVQLMELDIEDVTGDAQQELSTSSNEILEIISKFNVDTKVQMNFLRESIVSYNIEEFSINELLKKRLSRNEIAYRVSGVDFEYSVDEISVIADREKLEYIVGELLENAQSALDECDGDIKKIALSVKMVDESCEITVSDTGLGIEYNLQRYIYSKFFTTYQKRYGLGLSKVKQYIEDWGGEINFDSTPNKGCQFKVKFPTKVVLEDR